MGKYISNKKLSVDNEDSFIVTNNNDGDDDYEDDDFILNEDRLTKSNVYSMNENILLLWVSVHFNKQNNNGNHRFFANFSELNDGIGIAYLLQSYSSHSAELERINTRTPLNDHDKNVNASLIIQTMKKLGLNMAITPDDIT